MRDDFSFLFCLSVIPIISLGASIIALSQRKELEAPGGISNLTEGTWKTIGIGAAITLITSVLFAATMGDPFNYLLLGTFLSFALGMGKCKVIDRYTVAVICICLVLAVISGCAVAFGILGVADGAGQIHRDWQTCLYFSIVTFMTVGYGDLHPTGLARAVAAGEAISQYFVLGTALYKLTTFQPADGKRDGCDANPTSFKP